MAENTGPSTIGRRVREIRVNRKMTLEVIAGLAGMTKGNLSKIENGHQQVDKRSTLEALGVAPSELAATPFPDRYADPLLAKAHATLVELELALSDVGFGDTVCFPRPWPAVRADLEHLNAVLRPSTDYAAQGAVLPGLIRELNALVTADPVHRAEVLAGLMTVYHTAAILAKNMGALGLPALATLHARRVAEELDDPAWLGLAGWLRATTLGGGARQRMYELSMAGARDLEPHLGDRRCREMHGAMHLNASLAQAAMRRPDSAADHLAEAATLADGIGEDERSPHGFGHLYFGPHNVGIWKVTLAVELGDPGAAKELAAAVNPAAVPSAARQGMFWADLGRGLATRRADRDAAVRALVTAERLAPQRIRTNPMARETVTDLRMRARRDAGGRELRGLAFRMGLAG